MERRRGPRRVPDGDDPLARVRLRTGSELAVIDVSTSGVLVEGAARLLPGTHLELHIVTPEGRVLVRCRVVRAFVCRLAADVVRYRGALAFDRAVNVSPSGYQIPPVNPGVPNGPGTTYPVSAPSLGLRSEARVPA